MKPNLKNDKKHSVSLANPDKLVVSTRKYYSAYYKKKWNSPDISLPHLNLNVSEQELERALLFMDTFIKALRKRGHDLKIEEREAIIFVDTQKIKVALREKTKVIKTDSNGWARTGEPTGIFVLKIESWGTKEWTDSNQSLEDRLPELVTGIELRAESSRQKEIERDNWKQEYERQRAIKLAFEQRRKEDLLSFKNELEKAERWHKTNNLRDYINEVEIRAKANDSYTDELKSHLERLKQQADWYDPFIESKDELLDSVKQDTLELPRSEFSW